MSCPLSSDCLLSFNTSSPLLPFLCHRDAWDASSAPRRNPLGLAFNLHPPPHPAPSFPAPSPFLQEEDLTTLGFHPDDMDFEPNQTVVSGVKERAGFVSGLAVKGGMK